MQSFHGQRHRALRSRATRLGCRDVAPFLPDDGAAQPFAGQIGDDGKTVFPAIGDGAAGNLGSGATWSGLVAINVGTREARVPPPDNAAFLGGRTRPDLAGESYRHGRWPEPGHDGSRSLPSRLFRRLLPARGNFRATRRRARPAKKIVLSDGILQSPALLQILADSLGRDLEICDDQEASLRGAALHAFEQLGHRFPGPKFKKRLLHDRGGARRSREERAASEVSSPSSPVGANPFVRRIVATSTD